MSGDKPRKPSTGETLRKALRLIEPDTRWRWTALVVLSVTVSVLEALGAVLMFGLLSLLADGSVPVQVPFVGELRSLAPDQSPAAFIRRLLGFMAAFFIIRGGLFIAQAYMQHRLANSAAVRLSTRLLRTYLTMPYAAHLQRNSADLIRNAFESVNVVSRFVFVPLVEVAAEGLLVVGIFGVLIAAAPAITALAAAFLAPLVILVLRLVQPRLSHIGRANQEATADVLRALQQALNAVRDVKLMGREPYFTARLEDARLRLARANYRQAVLAAIPRAVLETSFVLAMLGLVLVTTGPAAGTADPMAVLGLFGYAVLRITPALNRAVVSVNNLKYGGAAIEHLTDDLRITQDSVRADSEGADLAFRDAVELRDVCFSYEGTDKVALDDVNLRILKGEAIGIVGPSGSGKSTLVDLLIGLLQPTRGMVLVDGVDIAAAPAAWHRHIGMVPQSVYLIDDTMRRNIALGVEEDAIDEAALANAVQVAQLDTFVANLPMGLDTVVGERGARLSGGQRQRVAIARALYRQPELLIFDEGTSALDTLTEEEFIAALDGLRGTRTVVTVAHRLTTVRSCDRIVLVRAGRIAAVGTFDELLQRDAEFRRMAR